MALVAVGVLLVIAGTYLVASPPISINEGNQCGVGCRDVSGTISFTALGGAMVVAGAAIAVYGFRKKDEDD